MNPTVFRLAVLAGWGLAHPSWAFVVPPNTNTNSNTNTQAPGVVVFGTTTDHGEEASNTRREAPTTTTATATATTTTTTNTHHPTKEPLVDVVAEMTEKALLEMGPNEMTMDDVAVALRNRGFVDTTTADDDANAVATLEADPVEEGITTTAAAALDQTWAETLEIASPSSTISNSNSNEDDANEMQIQMQMEIGRDDDPDLDELVSQVLAKNGIPSVATKDDDDDDDDTVRTAAMDAAMDADADADESEIDDDDDDETDHDAAVPIPSAATENPASALATSENNNNNNKDTKDIAKNNKDVTWFELIGAAAEAAGAIGGVAIRAASDVLAEGAAFSISRETVKADVSVPYESASFLAYTEWLVAHHKEDPELDRYENFRTNYKRVAIANVVAKKGYRDALLAAGEEEQLPPTAPELLCLDQYADLSEEEYRQVRESMKPRSVGDLLGQLASRTGKAAVDMANTIVVVDEASRNRRSTSTSTSTSTSSKDNTKDSTPEPTEQKPETPGISFSVGTMPFSFSKTADKKSNKKPAATETKKSPTPPTTKPKQPQAPAQPTKTNFFHRLGSRTLTSSKKQTSPNPKSAKKTAAMGSTRTGTSTSTSTSTIPALSQWRQNRDGSITGYVSNSQTYRTGTKITTSPVSQDARGGTVVETDSGSRYRLK
eukprot:jgi/Psemu1/323183/estExt_fgenesh1_pg.C_590038